MCCQIVEFKLSHAQTSFRVAFEKICFQHNRDSTRPNKRQHDGIQQSEVILKNTHWKENGIFIGTLVKTQFFMALMCPTNDIGSAPELLFLSYCYCYGQGQTNQDLNTGLEVQNLL